MNVKHSSDRRSHGRNEAMLFWLAPDRVGSGPFTWHFVKWASKRAVFYGKVWPLPPQSCFVILPQKYARCVSYIGLNAFCNFARRKLLTYLQYCKNYCCKSFFTIQILMQFVTDKLELINIFVWQYLNTAYHIAVKRQSRLKRAQDTCLQVSYYRVKFPWS